MQFSGAQAPLMGSSTFSNIGEIDFQSRSVLVKTGLANSDLEIESAGYAHMSDAALGKSTTYKEMHHNSQAPNSNKIENYPGSARSNLADFQDFQKTDHSHQQNT